MANYKEVIELFRKKEGGMSNDPRDTAAAANPAPCTITYRGQTANNWHTNKGITWLTFKNSAPLVGYPATCVNFRDMPQDLWEKIMKYRFWDYWNLDSMKSQVIAEAVVWWTWGSGHSGAFVQFKKFLQENYGVIVNNPTDVTRELDKIAAKDEKKLFDEIYQWRLEFLRSLKNYSTYGVGWERFWNEFYTTRLKKVGKRRLNTKDGILIIAILLLFIGGILFVIQSFRSEK